jgi:NhaP-type Na+/H+ or K+/H+ antiporter
VAGGSALVFALVLGWALGVFTRRLFGVDVGDFFSSFVVGAVVHPLLGVVASLLFSWAMFGKARDAAAAAVLALSLFSVLLPGLIWTSVSTLSPP